VPGKMQRYSGQDVCRDNSKMEGVPSKHQAARELFLGTP
jgi:hypothetical protein